MQLVQDSKFVPTGLSFLHIDAFAPSVHSTSRLSSQVCRHYRKPTRSC